MPKKVKVVDVASNNEVNEDEKPTDNIAQADAQAINEEVNDLPINDGVINDIEEEPKPKAKPRAKPRAKKPQVEVIKEEIKDEPNILTTLEVVKQEEPKEEPNIDDKPIKEKIKKEIELVKCPRCDKLMQAKSLRYTHESNCKGIIPIKTEERPVKRREPREIKQETKQDIKQDIKQNNSIIVDTEIQNLILKTIENQKLKQKNREEKFKKLTSNIA